MQKVNLPEFFMFTDNPKNTMKILNSEEGITDDGTHYLIRMRRDSTKFYTENTNAKPTLKHLQEVSEFISEITELEVSVDQATQIINLYPHTRIKIAVYDGISDTDVRDGISGAVAHYFLGCSWPTYGDEIDTVTFVDALKKEAHHHGFTALELFKST